MRKMSISEFRKLTKAEIETIAPVILTFDGSIIGVFSALDEVIITQDLHPRVRNKLRALEQRARVGMPKPEKVFVDEMRS